MQTGIFVSAKFVIHYFIEPYGTIRTLGYFATQLMLNSANQAQKNNNISYHEACSYSLVPNDQTFGSLASN